MFLDWQQPQRRVLVVFLGLAMVFTGALSWLGWRLLEQDRSWNGSECRNAWNWRPTISPWCFSAPWRNSTPLATASRFESGWTARRCSGLTRDGTWSPGHSTRPAVLLPSVGRCP